jgi:hypothetical protein
MAWIVVQCGATRLYGRHLPASMPTAEADARLNLHCSMYEDQALLASGSDVCAAQNHVVYC